MMIGSPTVLPSIGIEIKVPLQQQKCNIFFYKQAKNGLTYVASKVDTQKKEPQSERLTKLTKGERSVLTDMTTNFTTKITIQS